jgi:predicted kinase
MADDDNDGWSTVPTKQMTSSSSSSNNKSQKTRKQKQKQKQQRHDDDYDVVIAPTAASSTNIGTYKSPFMVICVGLPGSGKSTFSRSLIKSNPNKFGRINQDELKTRQKCERKVKQMLLSTSTSTSSSPLKKSESSASTSSESSSPQSIQQQQQQQLLRLCPIIDRCNFDMTQRSTWYRLAEECVDGGNIPVDVVLFDIPYEVCLRRCEIRKGHETIKSPQQAAGILKQLKSQWKPPSNKNNDERKRYRSLTIIRTEQEQKECLIRILNQPY